jgi:hypothetical protein
MADGGGEGGVGVGTSIAVGEDDGDAGGEGRDRALLIITGDGANSGKSVVEAGEIARTYGVGDVNVLLCAVAPAAGVLRVLREFFEPEDAPGKKDTRLIFLSLHGDETGEDGGFALAGGARITPRDILRARPRDSPVLVFQLHPVVSDTGPWLRAATASRHSGGPVSIMHRVEGGGWRAEVPSPLPAITVDVNAKAGVREPIFCSIA